MFSYKEWHREFIYKICEDVLNNRIKTFEEIQKLWPANLPNEKIYDEILEALPEYFVGLDLNKGKINENWDSFLEIYTAYKVLQYDEDLDTLYKAYKTILKMKNLTKDKIDKEVVKLLGNI